MTKIKLIAIDMDGTLLDPSGIVSEKNKNAIIRAREKGIKVVIATGRGVHSTMSKLDGFNVDALITCNGTILLDTAGNIQKAYSFTQEEIRTLVKWLREAKLFFEAYTRDGYIVSDGKLRRWRSYMKMSPERSLKHFVTHVKEISHFRKTWSSFKRYPLETTPYVKLFIWDDDENKLKKLRHSVPENLNVHVTDSGSNNIEIIPNSCSKYKMILHLAESMGIEQTGIASIGDSNNDLEMLVHSKLGIAMGNSPNEIKKIAKWVTSSNREDGVAYAIEYILNSNK